MVQQLLALTAVLVLVLGLLDGMQTHEDQNPPVVAAEKCPILGVGQRYVRIQGALDPRHRAGYAMPTSVTTHSLEVLFAPLGSSWQAGHVLVCATGVRIPGRKRKRLALPQFDPETGEELEPPPPDPDEDIVPLHATIPTTSGPQFGLLSRFPPELAPVASSIGFAQGVPISVFDPSVQPPNLGVPVLMVLLGVVALFVLTSGDDEHPQADDAPQGPEWVPFHTVPPATAEAFQYLALTVMIALLCALPRYFRFGGPHVYDSLAITVVYAAAAAYTGFSALRKAQSDVRLSRGGLEVPSAARPLRRVPWTDIACFWREAPESEKDDGFELVLETKTRRRIRLELGKGPDAARTAAQVAGIAGPELLADLLRRIVHGEQIAFDAIRLGNNAMAWEDEKGLRWVDYTDLAHIRLENGVLAFRLIASEWDAYRCHYQEMQNGVLLPALLEKLVRKQTRRCEMNFEKAALAGRDEWVNAVVSPPEIAAPEVVQEATSQATPEAAPEAPPARAPEPEAPPEKTEEQLLQEALAALTAGRSGEALAPLRRLQTLAEGRASPLIACGAQALGCILIDQGQATEGSVQIERAVAILDVPKDQAASAELARALINLAIGYWHQKRFPEALPLADRGARMYAGLPDAAPLHVALAYNALAGLQATATQAGRGLGSLERLFSTLEHATARGGLVFPPAQLDRVVENAEALLTGPRSRDTRVQLRERAAVLARALWGEVSLPAAERLYLLCLAAIDRGDLAGARSGLEQALGQFEQLVGESHPSTGRCLDQLGEVAWLSGDTDGATQAWTLAMPILEATAGDDARAGRLSVLRERISGRIQPGLPASTPPAPAHPSEEGWWMITLPLP